MSELTFPFLYSTISLSEKSFTWVLTQIRIHLNRTV